MNPIPCKIKYADNKVPNNANSLAKKLPLENPHTDNINAMHATNFNLPKNI